MTSACPQTHMLAAPPGGSTRRPAAPPTREPRALPFRAVPGCSVRLAHELREDAPEAEAPTLSADELIERFVEEFEAEILPEPEPESEETS